MRACRLPAGIHGGSYQTSFAARWTAAMMRWYVPQRVITRGRKPFDRRHLRALHRAERRDARAHCLAIHMHRARAAVRGAAAELRPRELQLIAEHPQERRAFLRLSGYRLAIEIERDHRTSSFAALMMTPKMGSDQISGPKK